MVTAAQKKAAAEKKAEEGEPERSDATVTPDPVELETGTPAPGADPGDTDAEARDTGSADEASVHAPANQNAATAGRGEELFAAEQTVRGGVTPAPAYPVALPREEQEANAQEAAHQVAKNMTGTKDGISSVLPAVGGTTNMAMTSAERLAQLDDTAVDAQGRLVGDYLDDRERRVADERRNYIEGRAGELGDDARQRRAAAERVRSLASSPATSAADVGKAPGDQALVNPDKHTSHDSSDVNSEERRAAERAEANQAGGARA